MSPADAPQGPTELAVRPDRARYRRYFALRWTLAALIVGILLVGATRVDTPDQRTWVISSAVIFGAVVVAVQWWRHRTYLDPEPSLVLRTDQFRILHKGRHLWVPWTDVSRVQRTSKWFAGRYVAELLVFDVRTEAQWKLPPDPAPLVDQMMLWRADDLVYSRPCDTPRIEELERIAQRLHDQATGGHGLPAAQRAHWPEDLRGAGS